ncbi:MAG: phosphate transport system substrate-binding protein [Parvibaculaceae bacterium]|nr:PstS family phosphate ABC transporter substrate-binding protein [Parvibaculaceae bacterium]
MKLKTLALAASVAVASISMVGVAHARDQIQIVGSSTVFPFSTKVAEEFGHSTSFKTPVVESTGSGGGMKLFCSGVGMEHPDITNASRRIKSKEFKKCTENGITITEVKVGYDGIVLGNAKSGAEFFLTTKDIFLALAKEIPDGKGGLIANPNKTWADVNKDLPTTKIEVLGPPPTSGTRDAFVELAMEKGAKKFPELKALRKADKKAFKAIAHSIREDGAFIEAGENDNLIVQKLVANPDALGIFGFSFLDQNADKIKGAIVEGNMPSFERIANGDYPISRSLFFYVKKEHVGKVPGIEEFVAAFTNEDAWGTDGYLVDKGLIPLPDAERASMAEQAKTLAPLAM